MRDAGDPAASRLLMRIEALARISDESDCLTRLPLGEGQRQAGEMIAGWMRDAGMDCHRDATGNLIGQYPATPHDNRPVLALGSHFDTVRNAGRFDGTLGVLAAIETVQALHDDGIALDVTLQVLAFEDEEGVCFGTSRLGSHAYSGMLTEADLAAEGAGGLTVADRLRAVDLSPEAALQARATPPDAYVELHIEQGPVLEAMGAPLGVVSSIVGQTRLSVTLLGAAGHAGTVPMRMRRDALAGAAECVLAIEALAKEQGVVATVGQLDCRPGAINVIPGEAAFTVDMRSGDPARQAAARTALDRALEEIAGRRGLTLTVEQLSHVAPTTCDPTLLAQLAAAVGAEAPIMESGAGHDAIAMSRIAPVGMLFVACRGGISHDPAEHVEPADVSAALQALRRFVTAYSPLRT
ncbi:Zn-dependent hydrolase [Ponticoccus alexandrii]|uniref:Hydantoinase/carbamoylase family amidase n=1 Tax=Ponticoccus alexandrii TaxID=1943633 RepID=A0ABX7F7Q8_9RHOB|nr:Zn-dependent hydrolase [Ponticoccus alexandrii]ETA51701.1 hypothetical protein P279_12640 [Rhodobacteraceae bacterium PD-2]QRF66575.1 hydantoinase/carbamoylase family amidase [Ponticoccus alexandrii]